MEGHKTLFALLVAVAVLVPLTISVDAYTRDELSRYKEVELIAPDFTLKSLDGNTHTLSDFKSKQFVVLQFGSST